MMESKNIEAESLKKSLKSYETNMREYTGFNKGFLSTKARLAISQ